MDIKDLSESELNKLQRRIANSLESKKRLKFAGAYKDAMKGYVSLGKFLSFKIDGHSQIELKHGETKVQFSCYHNGDIELILTNLRIVDMVISDMPDLLELGCFDASPIQTSKGIAGIAVCLSKGDRKLRLSITKNEVRLNGAVDLFECYGEDCFDHGVSFEKELEKLSNPKIHKIVKKELYEMANAVDNIKKLVDNFQKYAPALAKYKL